MSIKSTLPHLVFLVAIAGCGVDQESPQIGEEAQAALPRPSCRRYPVVEYLFEYYYPVGEELDRGGNSLYGEVAAPFYLYPTTTQNGARVVEVRDLPVRPWGSVQAQIIGPNAAAAGAVLLISVRGYLDSTCRDRPYSQTAETLHSGRYDFYIYQGPSTLYCPTWRVANLSNVEPYIILYLLGFGERIVRYETICWQP